MGEETDDISIGITGLSEWDVGENQVGRGLLLVTNRGPIQTIIHHDPTSPTHRGIVWVGGARGGFEGPAGSMYKLLGDGLSPGITSIRLDYRQPNVLVECVMDTLAALSFLSGTGHTDVILVGHSFGGAVVIKAAPYSEVVKGVIALSSQTFGAGDVSQVSPSPILLVHGERDTVLSQESSLKIFEWAEEPKELRLIPENGHGLQESAQEIRQLVSEWLVQHLYLPGELTQR
ncbi:MAG: dienelactone hydrolase family protein [Chloroflexota bacterium]|nr:dienelactone hydrolase family protein [Chloroflexota bacterium]